MQQVDNDGKITYSKIEKVSVVQPGDNSFIIVPDPAYSNVQLNITSKEQQQLTISISDVEGRIYWNTVTAIDKGSITIPVSVNLKRGTYFVTIYFKDDKVSKRFVKMSEYIEMHVCIYL